MVTSYLLIAWRNLRKNRLFSFINIFGLALGIACELLIILHIKEELSFDKGFSKSERLYRLSMHEMGDQPKQWAAISPVFGSTIQNYIPEVQAVGRLHRPPSSLLSYEDEASGLVKRFEEQNGLLADSSIIGIFDLEFIGGDAKSALSTPDAIILTQSMANRYFGSAEPLGKVLMEENRNLPLKVAGVVKDFPFNTHLSFDFLLSMSTFSRIYPAEMLERRTWAGFYTYLVLQPGATDKMLSKKLSEYMVNFYELNGEKRDEILTSRALKLQPVRDIHLYSKLEKEMSVNSDITYVYIFSVVAAFILLVAAVNFVNTSTAQAIKRMKEIGMRKVIGATRAQLFVQFIAESFLTTLAATALALLFLSWAMPFYEQLTSRSLDWKELITPVNRSIAGSLIVLVGFASGLYPAWFVAQFNPITSIKGEKHSHFSVNTLRKGLIVFQFVVSVFMIFCTVIVYRQMQLFHKKDLGFDKEQIIAVKMYGEMWQHFTPLLNKIDQNRNVIDRTTVSTLPGERFSFQGMEPLQKTADAEYPNVRVMWTDHRLVSALKLQLVQGANFFQQMPDIKKKEFIMNEAAVKAFKLKNPIGLRMVLDIDTGEVVGVVKDFNFASLHSAIEPMVLAYNPYRSNYLLLKTAPGTAPQVLNDLKKDISSLTPSALFIYTMLDEKLDRLYVAENKMSMVFKLFAFFSIFISCLGLFGLSAYAAQLRTKELGIRKVLGASPWRLSLLLSSNFVVLVLIAIVIALPLAGFTMHHWLEGFAYRTELNAWIFVVSGCSALLLAFATVGLQSVKATMQSPIKSLKAE